jgi:hypothetical protein
VVQQRGEPFLLPLSCRFSYAAQRLGHAGPVLRPERALLVRVPLGPPPFAPPAPPRIAPLCSPASSLLWQGLTSHFRASSASAHRLPDADHRRAAPAAGGGISRFPYKERPHMPGSLTAPSGRALAMSRPSVLPSGLRKPSAPRGK